MARISLRHFIEAIVARLRGVAAMGRPMERCESLAGAGGDQSEVVARLRQRQSAYGARVFSDSADIVREMRDQRVL